MDSRNFDNRNSSKESSEQRKKELRAIHDFSKRLHSNEHLKTPQEQTSEASEKPRNTKEKLKNAFVSSHEKKQQEQMQAAEDTFIKHAQPAKKVCDELIPFLDGYQRCRKDLNKPDLSMSHLEEMHTFVEEFRGKVGSLAKEEWFAKEPNGDLITLLNKNLEGMLSGKEEFENLDKKKETDNLDKGKKKAFGPKFKTTLEYMDEVYKSIGNFTQKIKDSGISSLDQIAEDLTDILDKIEQKANQKINGFHDECNHIENVSGILRSPIKIHYDFRGEYNQLEGDLSTLSKEELQERNRIISASLETLQDVVYNDPQFPKGSFGKFADNRKRVIDGLKEEVTKKADWLSKFNPNIAMIMDEMKYRYSKLEEEILPIIKDPENTELDQLRNNLENAKREVEKAELVQDGSAKLQEIRDTRPENINEYNQACKEEYCKRYETQILKSNSGGWDIRAKIRGQRYASYQAELIFEEGTVIGKHAYQRRPEHESHTFRRRPDGIFDNEIDYQGTKPLKHSIITFNMINDCLEHLRSEGHDITKWKLIKYKGENIVEPKSKYVIDSFTDKGNKKKIWEKGTPGYEAWAKTLVGAGKFYLAAHHYDNTEIKSIELETYEEIQGKNAFTVQYHATYNFGDKNE